MHKKLYFGKHTIRYSQITKNVILIILSFEAVYIYTAVVVQKKKLTTAAIIIISNFNFIFTLPFLDYIP